VNERTAVFFGAFAGAIAGAACAYLFLTERGRALREDLAPRVADFVDEVQRARGTAERARAAFEEARRAEPPGRM
jgi:gas vesicle protein